MQASTAAEWKAASAREKRIVHRMAERDEVGFLEESRRRGFGRRRFRRCFQRKKERAGSSCSFKGSAESCESDEEEQRFASFRDLSRQQREVRACRLYSRELGKVR